jgi:hypothetical protein
MTDQQPLSPWKLTPPRILILVLGILALFMIVGALTGGVTNLEILKESGGSSAPSSSQPAQ